MLSGSRPPFLFPHFWLHRIACGILVPDWGWNLHSWQWKHWIPSTGLPGNSLKVLSVIFLSLATKSILSDSHWIVNKFQIILHSVRGFSSSVPVYLSNPFSLCLVCHTRAMLRRFSVSSHSLSGEQASPCSPDKDFLILQDNSQAPLLFNASLSR